MTLGTSLFDAGRTLAENTSLGARTRPRIGLSPLTRLRDLPCMPVLERPETRPLERAQAGDLPQSSSTAAGATAAACPSLRT